MQSTGAEILHVACILAERRGLKIVAPVHDAIMAEGRVSEIKDVSRALDRVMRDASAIVLQGYELATEAQSSSLPTCHEYSMVCQSPLPANSSSTDAERRSQLLDMRRKIFFRGRGRSRALSTRRAKMSPTLIWSAPRVIVINTVEEPNTESRPHELGN